MSVPPSRPRRALPDDVEIPHAALPLGETTWRPVSDASPLVRENRDELVAPVVPRRASALEPLPEATPTGPTEPPESDSPATISVRDRTAMLCARLATAFAVAAAVLSVVWLLPWLQYATSAIARLGRLVGYAWPLWAIAALLAGGAWLMSRKPHYLPLVVASLLGLILHSVAWAPMFFARSAPVSGPTLRVASINVDAGRMNAEDLVAEVQQRDIDVAVVQEITPGTYQALTQAGWDELFPHHWGENLALMIFSKHPIEELSSVETQQAVAVKLAPEGGPWTIIAGHPADPGERSPQVWRADSQHLADLAAAQDADVPSAIVGNLNATAQQAPSIAYRAAGFHDTRRQVGAGWLPTWPDQAWFPPYAGLEQVLTGPKARVVHLETFPVGRHRGLVAELAAT